MSKYLAFVLVHIEFTPIPDSVFAENKNTFIERLLPEYPMFKDKESIKQVDVQIRDDNVNIDEVTQPLVKLSSHDRKSGVRLTTNHLTLFTTSYSSFDDFRQIFVSILGEAKESFNLSHYTFLGLRYINRFEFEEGVEVDKFYRIPSYLQPEICGWAKGGSNHNTGYLTNDSTRVNIQGGVSINSPLLPAEIFSLASDVLEINPLVDGVSTFLDIDSFDHMGNDVYPELDVNSVEEKLIVLRKHSRSALETIINTDNLGMN